MLVFAIETATHACCMPIFDPGKRECTGYACSTHDYLFVRVAMEPLRVSLVVVVAILRLSYLCVLLWSIVVCRSSWWLRYYGQGIVVARGSAIVRFGFKRLGNVVAFRPLWGGKPVSRYSVRDGMSAILWPDGRPAGVYCPEESCAALIYYWGRGILPSYLWARS